MAKRVGLEIETQEKVWKIRFKELLLLVRTSGRMPASILSVNLVGSKKFCWRLYWRQKPNAIFLIATIVQKKLDQTAFWNKLADILGLKFSKL